MDNKRWMIVNVVDQTEFWCNDYGWCDYYDADSYTSEEKEELNLPIDGEWIHIGWY